MTEPNLTPAEQLLVGLQRWTDFAEQCARRDDRARDGAQQLACGLEHIERGLMALDALVEDVA